MKNIYIIIIASIIFINTNFAQNTLFQEKEQDGYLVYFEPNTSQNSIDSVLDLYNSHEIWITKYSKVRYWKVNEFPFTINDSTTINTMDDLYDTWINDNDDRDNSDSSNKNSNVGNFSFNYRIKKIIQDINYDFTEEQNNYCFNPSQNLPQGNNTVLINIMDTGLDYNSIPNNIVSTPNGHNFITSTGTAQDDNGHGTHLTSIIGTMTYKTNNNKINLFESKTHNYEGKGKLSDIIQAIDHSIDLGAKIINASWTFYDKNKTNKTPLQIAIEKAGEFGILFVAASGNDAIDNDNDTLKAFPASYPSSNIIAVSSNNCDSTLSYFSNYGNTNSDICAFGENIPGFVLNNQLAYMSGTSQATAFVSAIAATLGTYMDIFDPIKLKQVIIDGAKYNQNLDNLIASEGIIDFNKSLQLLLNNQIQSPNIPKEFKPRDNNELTMYPIPFDDQLTIEWIGENSENINIEIFNITGKKLKKYIQKQNIGDNTFTLNNLSNLQSGIYYIKLNNTTTKIIKAM